jgi:hypothetical protein
VLFSNQFLYLFIFLLQNSDHSKLKIVKYYLDEIGFVQYRIIHCIYIDIVYFSDCANAIHMLRFTYVDFHRIKLSKTQCTSWISNKTRIILNHYTFYIYIYIYIYINESLFTLVTPSRLDRLRYFIFCCACYGQEKVFMKGKIRKNLEYLTTIKHYF